MQSEEWSNCSNRSIDRRNKKIDKKDPKTSRIAQWLTASRMDNLIKTKEFHGNSAATASTTTTTTATIIGNASSACTAASMSGIGICSSDSFSMMPLPHNNDMVSANSIDLNAAASLSDDSGVPLTTNSSISSGDSYRLGMCKFEIELVESDGEVSQFDSLDNCSEGGMSAENFNTLKKGPLAPIDPPPEFQDSPQTTLVRSISKSVCQSLRRWTSSQSSFEHLKEPSSREHHNSSSVDTLGGNLNDDEQHIGNHEILLGGDMSVYDDRTLKESYAINKHMYSSDSILNSHTDNIYDEPNNIISSSLGNSVDALESSDTSSPLPPPPPPVSIVKIKQTLCPFYQDHTRYFKAIPSEQDHNVNSAAHIFHQSGLSEIHDYDLYYGGSNKRNTYQYENSLQRKQLIYSPIHHSHHCHHYHHYHTGTSLSGNRPNSRNSLNSRLSSSHNSLSVSSANKPDDSIFITQAMSHDALLTREISDFYNVPIDSDIYAFPVDMITSSDKEDFNAKDAKSTAHLSDGTIEHNSKCPHYKSSQQRSRNNRNKRKKRYANQSADNILDEDKHGKHSRAMYRAPITKSTNSTAITAEHSDELAGLAQEPLHMTLDEVKQFYHTLYADAKSPAVAASSGLQRLQDNKSTATKSSNETIWSISSSNRSRCNNQQHTNNISTRDKNALNCKTHAKNSTLSSNATTIGGHKLAINSSDNESIHNNNNINSLSNNNNSNNSPHSKGAATDKMHQQLAQDNYSSNKQQNASNNLQHSNKHHNHEKKSQFSLNLKQRFCSIFRFRRNNRYRSSSSATAGNNHGDSDELNNCSTQSAEDKRKKFQSRALPPLPNKAEAVVEEEEDKTSKEQIVPAVRPFQFTSSIEKVKDYGWYWGPLSSEAAEKVLSTEPDGSFIVRDSSDDHYIFSLSFKLNNFVRHVRIEQDQGTFSFGSYAKFKSQTITEFIEKAVEHSRSGRYLFFLHRRPEHGPMRVQLTNPVSRFKHVQSLQHMCRFVILKAVIRKDLIQSLPLPRRLLDYLNYKHCYSEQVESDSSHSQMSGDASS